MRRQRHALEGAARGRTASARPDPAGRRAGHGLRRPAAGRRPGRGRTGARHAARPAAAARSRTCRSPSPTPTARRSTRSRPTTTAAGRSTCPVPGQYDGRRSTPATCPTAWSWAPAATAAPSPSTRAARSRSTSASTTADRQRRRRRPRGIQLFVDGLRFGLLIAMCAVGLSLIFGTTGLTNFAHGELVTIGAVVAWYINVAAGIPLIRATLLAMVVGGRRRRAQRAGALAAAAAPRHRADRRAGRLDRPLAGAALPDPDRLRRPLERLRRLPEPAGGRLRPVPPDQRGPWPRSSSRSSSSSSWR